MPRFVKGKSRIVRKKVPPAVFPALSRGMVCRSDAKTEKLRRKDRQNTTCPASHLCYNIATQTGHLKSRRLTAV